MLCLEAHLRDRTSRDVYETLNFCLEAASQPSGTRTSLRPWARNNPPRITAGGSCTNPARTPHEANNPRTKLAALAAGASALRVGHRLGATSRPAIPAGVSQTRTRRGWRSCSTLRVGRSTIRVGLCGSDGASGRDQNRLRSRAVRARASDDAETGGGYCLGTRLRLRLPRYTCPGHGTRLCITPSPEVAPATDAGAGWRHCDRSWRGSASGRRRDTGQGCGTK